MYNSFNLVLVAYIIADSIEFNEGGAVDELAADAASDAKSATDSNSKKRRRKRAPEGKELLLKEGYIGIING